MPHIILSFLFIITLIPKVHSASKTLPLYELGAASVTVYSADYPASDEMSGRQVFAPTLIYRGDNLRQDRRGTRARFFKSEDWTVDIGTGISLPTNSEENKAREGMDDLGFIFEMGPRLIYTFFENQERSLLFLLPYRFAIATDFSFTKEVGTRFNPEIEYTQVLSNRFRMRIGIETNFGSEAYNDYIYEVDRKYVTPEREAYNADGGYIGSSLTAAFIYRGRKLSAFMGLSYNRYDRSANEESPLYKINEGTGIAIGFNYFFYSSDATGEKAEGID